MNKQIIQLALATGILWIASCQQETDNSKNNIHKINNTEEVTQETDNEALIALADSLDLERSKYEDLLDEKKKGDKKTDLYYRKIHSLQSENDSLTSVINGLQVVNEALNKEFEEPPLSKDEKAIQNMVHQMHASWKNLMSNKDPNEILKYFTPKFSVSRIAVETDNTAQISRFSHVDFRSYLKGEVIGEKGLSYEFGNVHFLSTEIKEDTYFNVAYKCNMRTYKNHKVLEKNSLQVTITGKKVNGIWRIASYSWVAFKYRK